MRSVVISAQQTASPQLVGPVTFRQAYPHQALNLHQTLAAALVIRKLCPLTPPLGMDILAQNSPCQWRAVITK